MANNYLQFAAQLDLLSEDEAAWLKELCLYINTTYDGDVMPSAFEGLTALGDAIVEEFESGFDYKFEGNSVTFVSDEGTDPALIAEIVHQFFRKMRPNGRDIFTIQWAEFCDKLRVGEFGGGACVVTREEIVSMTTGEWVIDAAVKASDRLALKKEKKRGARSSRR